MITFDKDGLIPVVIQDVDDNQVMMVAFMNEEALRKTRETGKVHFWSRSRDKLWLKGEQSGHCQLVQGIYVNCEENSLLIKVTQQGGAACHEGYKSCYFRLLRDDDTLQVIAKQVFDPEKVYHR